MWLPFQLAKRYLFSAKSTNAINIISGITIFGLTIGTAALILILSVFNGFEGLLSTMLNAFNPDIEVTPLSGKSARVNDALIKSLQENDAVETYSVCLEDLAMFQYEDIQEIGTLKGVDENYVSVTGMDTMLLYGSFEFERNGIKRGVIGSGLRTKLGVQVNQSLTPLSIFTLLKEPKFGRDFNKTDMYPSGVFSIQNENDFEYVLTNYGTAVSMYDKVGEFSTIEIKIKDDSQTDEVKSQLASAFPDFAFKNRAEQDATYLNLLKIEKWIGFLIVAFTLLLIAFNLVASLWMIVLEKQKDIATLKAMGYTSQSVFKTVMINGLIMSGIGLIAGFILAMIFYTLQKKFGILSMGSNFLVSAYPIELRLGDLFYVSLTVLGIGLLGSILPAIKARNISPNVRVE